MEIDVYELFKATPALVVFVVIGFGYFLGKLNIRGFELGPTGGVLLVGLLFGHFGFEGIPLVGMIGFTIFIYSVGLQAGPRFFNVPAPHPITSAFGGKADSLASPSGCLLLAKSRRSSPA